MTDTEQARSHIICKDCVVEDEPDAKTVWLKVGNQEFCLTNIACHDLEEAEWFKELVVTALATMFFAVREECAKIAERNTYMSMVPDEGGAFGGTASCEYRCGNVIAQAIRAGGQ